MSGIVGVDGRPIGRVGESKVPIVGSRQGMDPEKLSRLYEFILQSKASAEGYAAIVQRAEVSLKKIEAPIAFWKPVYFGVTMEGRHLNGIEAYELGDSEKNPGAACNKAPYIAMCNLMALEGIRMMGSRMPTSTEARLLAFATEREQEIAGFWKDQFAPTEFQVEWAWKATLSVLAGEPHSTRELLVDYKEQIP